VEDLTKRIRRVRQDLFAIEKKVTALATCPAAIPMEDMKALKVAVDEMRAFLWSYFQGLIEESERELLDRRKLPPPKPPQRASQPQVQSFFEEVQSLTSQVVERHMNGTKGVAD
jgi:hypothetical protein